MKGDVEREAARWFGRLSWRSRHARPRDRRLLHRQIARVVDAVFYWQRWAPAADFAFPDFLLAHGGMQLNPGPGPDFDRAAAQRRGRARHLRRLLYTS